MNPALAHGRDRPERTGGILHPPGERPRRGFLTQDRGAGLAVLAITVLAAALRLSQLRQGLYGDELFTFNQVAHNSLSGMFRAIRPPGENAPPLFFLLAWASGRLGDPTVWIRLPSVLAAIGTVPLLYALGRETLGSAAGITAAVIFTFSPFSVYYSVEARPYELMAFFLTLAAFAVLRATRTRRSTWWALYALSGAAAIYTGYQTVFGLMLEAAWSLWVLRRTPLRPILANAAIVVLYLPWLPHLQSKDIGIIGALEPFTATNVVKDFVRLVPGYPYAALHQIPTRPGLLLFGACLLVGVLFTAVRAGPVRPFRYRAHPATLVALVAAATPVGIILFSLVSTDIWDPRDLYASAPCLALLAAGLLVAVPRSWRVLLVGASVGVLVFGSARAISPSYARPPFRDIAAYIDRVARPRDPVILLPLLFSPRDVISIYLGRRHRLFTAVPAHWNWPRIPSGGLAVIVIQGFFGIHVSPPAPPGYRIVRDQHYNGLLPLIVTTYRRSARTGR